MSYKDKYGITEIFRRKKGDSFESLSLSWDYETNDSNRDERAGVFLYIPYEAQEDHSHIVFNLQQAKLMRDWLNDYIEDLESHGVKEITHFLTKG
jgi:hypothetical protein